MPARRERSRPSRIPDQHQSRKSTGFFNGISPKLHRPPSRLPPWQNRTVFLHRQGLRLARARVKRKRRPGLSPRLSRGSERRTFPTADTRLSRQGGPPGRLCPCDPDLADRKGCSAALLSNPRQQENDHRKDDPEPSCVDRHYRRKRSGSVRAAEHAKEVVARCAGKALWCRLCRRKERRLGSRLGRPHRCTPLFRCTYPNHFVREKSASPRPTRRSDGHRSKRRSGVVERPVHALCL
jgi:hypothetical protein